MTLSQSKTRHTAYTQTIINSNFFFLQLPFQGLHCLVSDGELAPLTSMFGKLSLL